MSHLVRNPEDRVSHNETKIIRHADHPLHSSAAANLCLSVFFAYAKASFLMVQLNNKVEDRILLYELHHEKTCLIWMVNCI